jgi:two-component system, sensor histidine kinase and response regulator
MAVNAGTGAIRELPSIAPSQAPREAAPPLDRRQLINRCLGRIELAERLIASFQTRFPNEAGQIERALAEGDEPNLVRLIHQLKGAAANVSAPALHALLTTMEHSARNGDRPAVVESMSGLYRAWDQFQLFLEAGATSPAASSAKT